MNVFALLKSGGGSFAGVSSWFVGVAALLLVFGQVVPTPGATQATTVTDLSGW